jgi:hypothetical protein
MDDHGERPMNCGPLLFLILLGLCALAVGAVVAHELLTRWRYDQALRTLIKGETAIKWPERTKP